MAAGLSGSGRRNKGSNFELKIAKQFTKWADGKAEYSRTFNSGAFSSTHGKALSSGDIETEALWPFSMELKNHESFTSLDTIYHSQANIQSFWNQNLGDAVRVRKVPMLITHRNRSKAYVTVPYSPIIHKDFRDAGLDYGIMNIRWHHDALDVDLAVEVITVVLEDFLDTYDYDTLSTKDKEMFARWYDRLEHDKDIRGLA